jgi:hypothetical protein
VLLTHGCGGEAGGVAFVLPLASPNHLWPRSSAKVSRSPHSHPKDVVPKDRVDRGPLSTILAPHSSHTRMLPLEGPSTTQPPPFRAAHTNVAYPKAHYNVNLANVTALSIMGSERTRPPQP